MDEWMDGWVDGMKEGRKEGTTYQYGVPINVFLLPIVLSNWALTPKSTERQIYKNYIMKQLMQNNKVIITFNSLRPIDAFICISKLTIMGSENGLSPGRRLNHYLNQCCNIVNSDLRNKLKYQVKFIPFYSIKCIWKCCLRNRGNFVSASVC